MSEQAKKFSELLDVVDQSSGLRPVSNNIYNILHGINTLGGILPAPANSDNQGLVFFTKPDLNLSYNNVISIRKLAFLANTDPYSMPNFIRCMLNQRYSDPNGDQHRSLINDDANPFMTISNMLLTLSQPPDFTADTYTSDEGFNKEQYAFVDGKPNSYGVYDLTATFANIEGDPISSIFTTWIEYSTRVAEGSLLPFPKYIVQRRIDYQTRIYRLILDKTRTFVQKIFCCGAAFPYTDPQGAVMGYTHNVHLTPEADQIQITFKCMGAIYNDPIIIDNFNRSVLKFNPDIAPSARVYHTKVQGLSPTGVPLKDIFNCRMYPYIADTLELEWYANTTEYNAILSAISLVETPVIPPATTITTNNIGK